MIQETDSKQLELPNGKEITLCEAVTAFAYGKVMDSFWHSLNNEAVTEEQRARARSLIERLHSAAYAGRIKFRALKDGDNHVDGHKDVDPLYFSEQRGLRWGADEIWSRAPSRRFPEFESRPPNFTMDWHDVHLDRKDFEALLRDEGVSIQQRPDADAPGERKTYKTGVAGRPTSKHLVLPMVRSRLKAGDYPGTFKEFSEQLAEAFAKAEPKAAPMKAKAIRNNAELRELWRHRSPKIIDPS